MQQSKNSELVRKKKKVIKQPVQKCNDRGLHLKAGKVGIQTGQASWEGRGSQAGVPCQQQEFCTGEFHVGAGVQQCIRKEQQAVKPSTTQPWPDRHWESKKIFLVGWRCLVVAVPMATCLSWTWQSPHIEENRKQQDLTGQTAVESHRLPLCCAQELENIIRTFLIENSLLWSKRAWQAPLTIQRLILKVVERTGAKI